MTKRLTLSLASLAACTSLGFATPSWSSEEVKLKPTEVKLTESQLDQTVAGSNLQVGLVNVNDSFNNNKVLSGNNILNKNNTAVAAGVGVLGIGAANASAKSY
jgi:polyribonucleotide nucleotidyltransferase